MATDVEESDTEDHERPAPAKRKCVKIINISNENGEQSVNIINNNYFKFIK